MLGLLALTGFWALFGAICGFVRNPIGAAVAAGLPVLLLALFFALGIYLNGSENTDQSGLSAMLTVTLMTPMAGLSLAATFLGWLAGTFWRAMRPSSDSSLETFE